MRLVLCAVLAVTAVFFLGCVGGGGIRDDVDLPIPQADPTNNLLTNATGQWPAPDQLVIVPEADFNAALEELPLSRKSSSNLKALDVAYAAGEVANDPWTGGLIAHEPSGPTNVTADVFMVARDAQRAATGEVLVTRYSIVPISMTVSASWSARGISFGRVPTSGAGTGRCCGKPQTCAPDSEIMPPVCPPDGLGFCGNTTFVPRRGSGVNNGIEVRAYNEGIEIDSLCFPKVDPFCSVALPVCDAGGVLSGSEEAEIPAGRDCLGKTIWRPFTGREVPEICKYISGEAKTGGGGGSPLPECDGQCFGCEPLGEATGSGKPRQCTLMRFTQGSDNICNSTPQQLAAEQAAMYVELGLLPGGSGEKCGGQSSTPIPRTQLRIGTVPFALPRAATTPSNRLPSIQSPTQTRTARRPPNRVAPLRQPVP